MLEIESRLDILSDTCNRDISEHSFYDIVSNVCGLFSSCSKHTFGEVKIGLSKQKDNIKPWCNSVCFFVRNVYHKSRKMYNKYKTA